MHGKRFPRERVRLVNQAIQEFMLYRHAGYSEDRALELSMKYIELDIQRSKRREEAI